MGMVFGKSSVAEPSYQVLHRNLQGSILPYEIRQYGERLAAETTYSNSEDSPFRLLASYIGVFGTPQNEGSTAMAMTAPVAMTSIETSSGNGKKEPIPIAMTAPVSMTVSSSSSTDKTKLKTMTFFLPAEYTTLQSVPKPTNPAVTIRSIPASAGAVHRFSGSMDENRANEIALLLAQQLRHDGLDKAVQPLTDEHVLRHRQAWGYDPPFTLPPFRRNEVWIDLTPNQVEQLVKLKKERQGGPTTTAADLN